MSLRWIWQMMTWIECLLNQLWISTGCPKDLAHPTRQRDLSLSRNKESRIELLRQLKLVQAQLTHTSNSELKSRPRITLDPSMSSSPTKIRELVRMTSIWPPELLSQNPRHGHSEDQKERVNLLSTWLMAHLLEHTIPIWDHLERVWRKVQS